MNVLIFFPDSFFSISFFNPLLRCNVYNYILISRVSRHIFVTHSVKFSLGYTDRCTEARAKKLPSKTYFFLKPRKKQTIEQLKSRSILRNSNEDGVWRDSGPLVGCSSRGPCRYNVTMFFCFFLFTFFGSVLIYIREREYARIQGVLRKITHYY